MYWSTHGDELETFLTSLVSCMCLNSEIKSNLMVERFYVCSLMSVKDNLISITVFSIFRVCHLYEFLDVERDLTWCKNLSGTPYMYKVSHLCVFCDAG